MTFLDFLFKNPSIIPLILSGFFLPLILVRMNLKSNEKLKKIEKEIESKHRTNEDVREVEKAVYASLSKILFDVQLLYVALSGSCIDKNCLEEAVKKFDESIVKYHGEIASNLLYMSSGIINLIYKFYGKISDLKIELKEFNESENYQMAHVAVNIGSVELASIVIEIQGTFVEGNKYLENKFNKTQQEMMLYCCGRKPPKELFDQYVLLLKQIKPNLTDDEIDNLTKFWQSRETETIIASTE